MPDIIHMKAQVNAQYAKKVLFLKKELPNVLHVHQELIQISRVQYHAIIVLQECNLIIVEHPAKIVLKDIIPIKKGNNVKNVLKELIQILKALYHAKNATREVFLITIRLLVQNVL